MLPATRSAARLSARRRPSSTRIAIAGTSVPISSEAVSSVGISLSAAAGEENLYQVSPVISTNASTEPISSIWIRLARRAQICTRRHQLGQRLARIRELGSAIVARLQHYCCTSARGFAEALFVQRWPSAGSIASSVNRFRKVLRLIPSNWAARSWLPWVWRSAAMNSGRSNAASAAS